MCPRVDEALFLSRADDVAGDLAVATGLLHLLEELLHETVLAAVEGEDGDAGTRIQAVRNFSRKS